MGQKIAFRGAGGGVETLPPAGDERREVLKQRTDELAEAAETQTPDMGRIDPDAFEIENEIAQHFNELDLPGWHHNAKLGTMVSPDGQWVPCWVQCSSSWGGRFINSKRAEGWEVVTKAMHDDERFPLPEHLLFADSTYRLGDVLLMRIKTDRYFMLQLRRRARQRAIEDGVAGPVEELAARNGVSLIRTDQMSPAQLDRLSRRSQAAQIASKQFDQQLRDGAVAGARIPR